MIRLDVDERFFYVEFRHQRRRAGGQRIPLFITAVTTCVIVATDKPDISTIAFSAIGTSYCWDCDNFSRRTGRLKAFSHAVNQCGALAGIRLLLIEAYRLVDPDPPPRQPRVKLSAAEKSERWQAGWELRKRREARRQVPDAREVFRAAIADEAAERSAS